MIAFGAPKGRAARRAELSITGGEEPVGLEPPERPPPYIAPWKGATNDGLDKMLLFNMLCIENLEIFRKKQEVEW